MDTRMFRRSMPRTLSLELGRCHPWSRSEYMKIFGTYEYTLLRMVVLIGALTILNSLINIPYK